MALRLCKGKYIINDINNIDYKYFDDENNKFIILTEKEKIVAYMDSSHNKYFDFAYKDTVFENGYLLLKKTNLEYIPVLEKNKIICFCYNDEYLDDALNKIKELIAFAPSTIFCEYSNAIIYGYNELAYYVKKMFIKFNFKFEIRDRIFLESNSIQENDKTMKLYVEGNTGLPIQSYSYWKVFHEWLYESIEPIYKIYNELSQFEYDPENYIIKRIRNNEPFMMARIGNTELAIIKQFLQKKEKLLEDYNDFWLKYLFKTSGFFAENGNLQDVDRYALEHIKAIKNCDFNLCYGHEELAEGLNLILKFLQKGDKYNYDWDKLNYPFNNSWFKYFEDKKILVISPYSKSIKRQSKILDKLFLKKRYPKLTIITYQSLETQLGNTNGFHSFFEALKKMEEDINKIDFDIAIICAGAYGYLLSSYIKNIGKSSIELCSYLPNWFGIKIKKYCTNVNVNSIWNENWIFPLEKPIKNSVMIEDSCYWE